MLVDGSVWAWGSGHGSSPARVEAYGADTAMRLHGSVVSNDVFVVLADGTAMRNGAAAELGGGIVEVASGYPLPITGSGSHTLVLKGE